MRSSHGVEPKPGVDLRRHERVEAQLLVKVAEHHPVDRQTKAYLQEVAENVSLGGLFIRTSQPFANGTSVQLNLRLSSDGAHAPVVKATAIVRWSRRWGGKPGMGLEFLDFEMNGRSDLSKFLRLVEKHPEVGRAGPHRAS